MSLAPCCCTVTPVLPEAFTRLLMIATACFIRSEDGALPPLRVSARKVACVPLDRSSPRATLKSLCHLPGLPMFEPMMPSSMTTINAASSTSARPGFEPLFLGGATCPVVPQSLATEPSLAPSFLGGDAPRPSCVRLAVDGQVVAVVAGGDGGLFVRLVLFVLDGLIVVGGLVVLADPILVGLVVLGGLFVHRAGVAQDLHDGALHVTHLDVRRDLEDHVVTVHGDHGGVHARRGADPGAGLNVVLLLLGLLLALPPRPHDQEVHRTENDDDEDDEGGAAAGRRRSRGVNNVVPHVRGTFPIGFSGLARPGPHPGPV